ncbi:MAG: hypothetical protein PGN09_12035 [Sphingomonas fennica]
MARASDTAPVHGFGWKLMVLLIVLAGATGLTALLIGRMQSVSQATDLQAFQRLAITAQSFAAWPRVAADIGRRSVPLRGGGPAAAADLIHPQFGRLPLRYEWGAARDCDAGPRLALGSTGMTVSGSTIRFGDARDGAVADAIDTMAVGGNRDGSDRICFAIGPLPYRHTLAVPEGFQALLLFDDQPAAAGRDERRTATGGRLVAQVGADVLPIRDTADIPDLQRLLHRAATEQKPATVTDSAGVISAIGTTLSRRDSAYLAPVDTAIAGRPYRLYVYPVTIRLGDAEQRMLVVGAMLPHPSLFDVNLNGSRIAVIGLLLLAFLTLTPFLRLDNLGAMDGVRQSDVMVMGGALMLGFAIAATIAALAVTSVGARRGADAALARQAAGLAGAIGGEISSLGECRQPGALAAAVDGGGLPVRPARPDDGCRTDGIAWPDVTIFIDADGQQAFAGGRFVPLIGYTPRPGALFDVGDRSYFVRARDRDVVPGTAGLAGRIARGLASCDRIPCRDPLSRALAPATGITIEQVLSRADGIAKTLLALPLRPADKTFLAKARARAVALGFVMRSMLAPAMPSGMRYAVIDLSQRPELPAIFHSDPERANAERFGLTLSAATLARFLNATRLPRAACAGAGGTVETAAFSGRYIGEDQRFATALVPCTEWSVVTFMADARIDARGIYPAEVALAAWMGFALVLVAALGLALVAIRRLTRLRFGMFWPDALQTETYRRIAIGLAVAIVAALAARFVFGLPGGWPLLLAPAACGAAFAYLLRQVLGRDGETPREAWLRQTPYLPVMNRRTERFYLLALALWLAMAAAVPVLLIAADADAHNRARIVAADRDAAIAAGQAKARALKLIGASQRGVIDGRGLPADGGRGGAPSTPPAVRDGNVAALLFCLLDRGPCRPRSDAAGAGKASADLPGADRPAGHAAGVLPHGVVFSIAWGSIVILALLLPAAMLRLFSRTLLGFGVPLEPVRYPRIRPGQVRAWTVSTAPSDAEIWAAAYPGSVVGTPDGPALPDLPERGEEERTVIRIHAAEWPDAAALAGRLRLLRHRQADRAEDGGFRILLVLPAPPPAGALDGELVHYHVENEPPYDEQAAPRLAMLVGGADDLRRRLRDYARPHTIDLYEIARKAPDEPLDPKAIDALLPALPPPGAPRPLVIAENLELLIRDDKGRGRALALLEELVRRQGPNTHRPGCPPAFRLLLLADISPLDRFLQASEWRDEETDAEATGGLDDPAERIRWSRLLENFTTYTGRVTPRQRTYQPGDTDIGPSLRFLLAEVAYLPDPVVRALLPDTDDTLLERDIVDWGQFLKDTSPAAIADFLASQLIEHYHYLWSISSRAEQILMHRMAAGELPVTRRAYALRSLVRRGIVVLDPAPRLMSYSFARFVRTVERPEQLRRWIRQAPQGGWTRIHGNLTIVLPVVLLLGGVLAVQGLVGIEAVVPLIAAAASALLRPLLSASQSAG